VEKNALMLEPGLEQGTEAFRKEAYAEVKSVLDSIGATHGNGQWKQKLMINDRIADSIFQQIVTRADEYQVLATPNLNGDYISDAAAAQIGGLGMAPEPTSVTATAALRPPTEPPPSTPIRMSSIPVRSCFPER